MVAERKVPRTIFCQDSFSSTEEKYNPITQEESSRIIKRFCCCVVPPVLSLGDSEHLSYVFRNGVKYPKH